jgi:5-formyltetrahydrofolate cyclo-ligase
MDLRAEKTRLQQSIRERLERLSKAEREAESRSICRRLIENLPDDVRTACAFVPIRDEVDIRPVLHELRKRGISIFLPCFEKALAFREARDFGELTPGAFRIPEPPPEADLLDPKALDLAIVPGRAFDATHNRLGRGNGGYDRWIRAQRAANLRTRFWGVCFECQVVNAVPMEPHDERVDAVITPRGML